MPEQGVKFLCKRAIENGQRQLTPVEKELLKKGIDIQLCREQEFASDKLLAVCSVGIVCAAGSTAYA